MSEYSDKIKLKVLKYSLRLEIRASISLAIVFNIDNPLDSISLGNTSSALSFDQKLNLLIDSSAVKPELKKSLRVFMAVRNQFMHNLNIDSFEDAFKRLEGSEKFLRNNYKTEFSEEIRLEQSLDNCITKIYSEATSKILKGGLDENQKRYW